ncbi:MAG: L,D-transpeptidase family protein [Chitinophagaceae bacterium]|nr:L,D-transpeptidase family protein [Chitinophagaceae bacterium]
MKKCIPLICTLLVLFACNETPEKPRDRTAKAAENSRDTTINAGNSYSDLFLSEGAVEQFIAQQHLNDTIANDLNNFYNSRNLQFAWFTSDGLNQQALSFRTLHDFTDTSSSGGVLDRSLDRLMGNDSLNIRSSDARVIKTELMMTWRFINYLWEKFPNKSEREYALRNLVPSKKQDVIAMAQATLKGSDDKIVTNDWYPSLQKHLKTYLELAKDTNWTRLPYPSKGNKKQDTTILLVKRRFIEMDWLSRKDTSSTSTPDFEAAVKKYQLEHALKADGKVTRGLIDQLNISPTSRLKQILVNLERMKWMPAISREKLILVNIPEFMLHVINGRDSLLSMPVVVGKQGHNTVMFYGSLNHVVFAPYWNLPPSIVEAEVLPQINQNEDYLAEHNMEITGEEDGLPVVRQLPGEKNELGQVKFLFPNSFNIYFHDTPHKDLFKQAKRAYSHGCIRLGEPEKLAKLLLADNEKWTDEKIDSAMNAEKETWVKVSKPVPVLIYYYTARVDDEGKILWRDDIYGRDKEMARRLFTSENNLPPQTIASRK